MKHLKLTNIYGREVLVNPQMVIAYIEQNPNDQDEQTVAVIVPGDMFLVNDSMDSIRAGLAAI